jgi:hypothetical protein
MGTTLVIAVAVFTGGCAQAPAPTEPEVTAVDEPAEPIAGGKDGGGAEPCPADHVISIREDCTIVPFELDPTLDGDWVEFKNRTENNITASGTKDIFGVDQFVIAAGDSVCKQISTETLDEAQTYHLDDNGNCWAIEATPRIIVRSSVQQQ